MSGRHLAGTILACTLLQTNCARYQPHSIDPVKSEAQLRARTLAITGHPDLQTLTDAALHNNPDLAVARAKVAAAEAAVMTARQRVNPSVAAEGGYNRTPDSVSTYSVSPAFTIETAGKRGYRILEAQKLAEASRIALYEAEWQVRSRVRTALVNYYFDRRRLASLEAEAALRADVVAIFEKRLAVGEAARPELNAARADEAALNVRLRTAEGEAAQAFAAIAAALGVPAAALEGQTFELTAFDDAPAPDALPLLRVEQAGLLHRADVRRTLVEYEAADAHLRLELANQYPNITLSPAYSFQEGFPAYTLGSVIDSIPAFHRHQGPIAEAEAARRQIEANFAALQARVIAETEAALRGYRAATFELGAAGEARNVQSARESAVTLAFRAGETDRLEVTQTRLTSVTAERAQLDALLRAQTALGSLQDAVQSELKN